MRHTAAEKYEIIRLVEGSDLPASMVRCSRLGGTIVSSGSSGV